MPQYRSTPTNTYFKPKHHFCTHFPVDILNLGPPRGYWCFSFEGMHRVVKKIAISSNFKHVSFKVMHVWSVRSACALRNLGGAIAGAARYAASALSKP